MSKKDAPNYRALKKDDDPSKTCSTCKAWDPNHAKATKPDTGYCEMYDFVCSGPKTCDAWTAKTENEGIYRIADILTEDPDIFMG